MIIRLPCFFPDCLSHCFLFIQVADTVLNARACVICVNQMLRPDHGSVSCPYFIAVAPATTLSRREFFRDVSRLISTVTCHSPCSKFTHGTGLVMVLVSHGEDEFSTKKNLFLLLYYLYIFCLILCYCHL